MKTVEKLLAFGSAVALAVGLAQCDNSGTNNTPADMATPAADLATTPPDLVTFNAPVITTVAPSWGINNAPTMITITGTDFRSGATVTVGGPACSNPTVTATQIMCTVPAKATTCAAQDVVVTNPVDMKTATKTGGFTYITSTTTLAAAPTPTLTSGTNPRRTASGDVNGI